VKQLDQLDRDHHLHPSVWVLPFSSPLPLLMRERFWNQSTR
jgi:hypothetical protein